ncbi:uncharacterized protein METZ01_LOCUS391340, partial [marine metagenome]
MMDSPPSALPAHVLNQWAILSWQRQMWVV